MTSILKNSSKSELAREIREGRLLIKGEEAATKRGLRNIERRARKRVILYFSFLTNSLHPGKAISVSQSLSFVILLS